MSTNTLNAPAEKITLKKSILEIEKEVAASVPEDATLVIELSDSKPSQFMMDGIGNEDTPENLDRTAAISFPSIRKIRNVSRIMIMDKGMNSMVYKNIRYIRGCSFIDMEKQIKENILPNALADMIVIKNGHSEVTKKGDIGLFLYLSACEYNEDSPYRPDDAENVFKTINTLIDTEAEENNLDAEMEALGALQSLKVKSTGSGTMYNTDAIEFLCSVFKLPSFGSGFSSEAWVALAAKAKDDPKKFLASIANARSLYESEAYQAVDFGVVTIGRDTAYFTDGEKPILRYDSDLTEVQKASALVDFISNPKNRLSYDELRLRLNKSKNAKLEIK